VRNQTESFVQTVLDDGYCVIPRLFSRETMAAWRESFTPLLERHVAVEGHRLNRGANRYYVTLPFRAPFSDEGVLVNDTVLAVVERLVGRDLVLCQLATDTPLLGSEHQETHRDTPPLFPETGKETPPYQLAVNFPLVDVTADNGPIEIARGTHMLSKEEGMARLSDGELRLEPVFMEAGDVMVRDVRGLHRGTPNRTDVPRPMVVLGFSRRWLYRPEVSISIPRAALGTLGARARQLLRENPVVESADDVTPERYQSFAY
jgi:ectoine hydroxylase-related dioxygenase (phytanoyl-CoA dioxygenase family)